MFGLTTHDYARQGLRELPGLAAWNRETREIDGKGSGGGFSTYDFRFARRREDCGCVAKFELFDMFHFRGRILQLALALDWRFLIWGESSNVL